MHWLMGPWDLRLSPIHVHGRTHQHDVHRKTMVDLIHFVGIRPACAIDNVRCILLISFEKAT